MDTKTIFMRLGLPKHAHAVYQSLQKEGPLLVSEIAKTLGIHRPAIYRALDGLLKNDLASCGQKGGRTFYKAGHPDVIAEKFSQATEKVATKSAQMATRVVVPVQEHVRFLEGRSGIQDAFDDVIDHLKRGETFYRYTSEKNLESVNSYLPKDYRARRDAKKLERLVISNPESGKQKRSRLERFIRYFPAQDNAFDQNIVQLVYGDRVSFIDLNTEKVVLIENRELAEFQKAIFKQLYKRLT